MVKFGRHLEFYQHHSQSRTPYVVPYNEIKARCIPTYIERSSSNESQPPTETTDTDSTDLFASEWRKSLQKSSEEFDTANRQFWSLVFAGIEKASCSTTAGEHQPMIEADHVRGALPDTALRLYLSVCAASEAQHLYRKLKGVHATALINSEALRKLVKKYDKDVTGRALLAHQRGGCSDLLEKDDPTYETTTTIRQPLLSSILLPESYSANFAVGLPTVEAALVLIGYRLGLDEDDLDEDEEEDDEHDHVEAAAAMAARHALLAAEPEAAAAAAATAAAASASNVVTDDIDDMVLDDDGFNPLVGYLAKDVARFFGVSVKRKDSDAIMVERRKTQLRWLKSLVGTLLRIENSASSSSNHHVIGAGMIEQSGSGDQSMYQTPPLAGISLLGCLVGHRGFHSVTDGTKRPIENSLMAYEAAWTNGIHLCECDVALTKDFRLILAHDENFTRLALDPTDPNVQRNVNGLTYKEIMHLPLKSGCRPVLLLDVLKSAKEIGGEARMIVEIKPGNVEAGTALAKMFLRYPYLMERCAAIMSFDAFAMQKLRRELDALFPGVHGGCHPTVAVGGAGAFDVPSVLKKPLSTAAVHRRGISVGSTLSGRLTSIPTAMSIGNIKPAMPTEAMAATAQAQAQVQAQVGMSNVMPSSHSIGMTLDGAMGSTMPLSSSPGTTGGFIPMGLYGKSNSIPRGSSVFGTPVLPPLKQHLANTQQPSSSPRGSPTPMMMTAPAAPTIVSLPKLLVITINGPPTNKEQNDALKVDIQDPDDLRRITGWLQGSCPQERLDGIYMQYQKCMINTEEGRLAMTALTDQYSVGIWGSNPKPADDFGAFSRLVASCGVSYVNSSLPSRFFKLSRSWSGDGGGAGWGGAAGDSGMIADGLSTEEYMEINSNTWPRRPKFQSSERLGLPW